jgi:very-short-patch-repair endonuclease
VSDFVNKALAGVRSKLLDLTRRNRLLNYKESAKSIRVVDELPDEVFRLLVQEEKDMQFLPLKEDSNLKLPETAGNNHALRQPNGTVASRHRDTRLQTPFGDTVLERRCKKLLQESRTAIEETGSNLLYMAIGFLEWYEADESADLNRAPLILVPVKIERSRIDSASNCYTYVISYTGEDIEINLSLAEKLNHNFDLILPSLDEDVSPESYFQAVAATVARRPAWRVAREMVLGLFSFSKLLMYKDLDPTRWPKGVSPIDHGNISCILGGRCDATPSEEQPYGEEYDLDRDSRAITLPLITDADSSQTSVIIDAIHHRENLVVEGPPGTGKSQTITNLIAAALHKGLSVLFVAEKKAALEVVRSRLNHAGLGDFCLELHSHKTQKGQLHADIGRRLRTTFRDARTLDHELSDLARERDRLMSYSNLVNSVVGPNGETIYDIFWAAERCRTDLKGQPPRFSVSNPLDLTRDQLNDRVNLLKDVARLRQDLPDEAIRAWQSFKPAVVLPGNDEIVAEHLGELIALVSSYQSYWSERLSATSCPVPLSIRELRRLRTSDSAALAGLPNDFHQGLAISLAKPANLATLEELTNPIAEYRQLKKASMLLVDNIEGDVCLSVIQQIANTTGNLESVGHGGETPQKLVALTEKQRCGCELLIRLSEAIDSVQKCFPSPLLTLDDCARVTNLHQVFASIPTELAKECHPEYTLVSTATTLADVRSACEKLKEDLKEQSQFFLLRYLPECSEIAALAKELRSFRGSFFAFLSSRYRNLRRTIKALLAEPKQFNSPDLIERLEGLIDTLTAIAGARVNDAYRQKLGPLYAGVETDWAKLEEYVSWGQKLSEAAGSQHHAYTLVPRLADLGPLVATATVTIKDANEDLTALLDILGLNASSCIVDSQAKLTHKREKLLLLLSPLKIHQRLATTDIATLSAAARAFLAAEDLEASLDEKRFKQVLKNEYKGMATDIERLLRTARWLSMVREQGKFQDELVAWLAETATATRRDFLKDFLPANEEFWGTCVSLVDSISHYGEFAEDSLFCGGEHNCGLDALAETAGKCREQIRYLITWGDYCRTLLRAEGLDLKSVTEAINSEQITPDESAAIYRHAVYDSMAREIIARNPELAAFTRAEFEGVRERYASIDRQIMKNTRERIAHITSARPVQRGISYGPVKNHTDLALIERELQKKKRHIPIRQLVLRAGHALQGLKPCFMMSPLSVAQYLEPGQVTFDLVVMDEASQLKPEDALGAIGRAKQLIVVGDPNQLPPTSFFDRTDNSGEEDDEVSAAQDTESILDICITTYRKRRLRWHYRSEHESLIAFSNSRFYDNDLIIFPSPLGKNRNYGVHRHYVEGATYQKGRNRVEAEAVAMAVVEHFRSTPKLSIGVATFNREQAELVLDVLERQQKQQPWLEQAIKKMDQTEEPFFVKNLENVQGDEREVIFVSTTYGPDQATGTVYQRFGPIASDTGWRRLNVIFTRAKKRLELFTSMRSADIKLGANPSKGTVALKEYLEYAETGLLPDYGSISGRAPDSDFEIAVAHHLNGYGFRTVAQVGVAGFFIDIGVLHPEREGEFVLGIECDGAAYHSAKSVRDRDRLRQEILEKKGWNIHRIWSTDWFKNRDREVQRLLSAVRKAVAAQASVATPSTGFQEAVAASLASLHAKSIIAEPDTIVITPATAVAKPAKGLREELVEYRQANILPSFPDEGNGILRDEILDRLVIQMPTTREEFYKIVPMELRQHTEGKQMQFLDDILEIIDAYA